MAFLIMNGAFAADSWLTDYAAALVQAKKENKLILLSFEGSDFCTPCKLMRKRVFETEAFKDYAEKNLVTILVDYPLKKPQATGLKIQNLEVGKKYNLIDPKTGYLKSLPVLILASANGHPLATQKLAFLFPSQFFWWAKKTALKMEKK